MMGILRGSTCILANLPETLPLSRAAQQRSWSQGTPAACPPPVGLLLPSLSCSPSSCSLGVGWGGRVWLLQCVLCGEREDLDY